MPVLSWLNQSVVCRYAPSQADAATYDQLKSAPVPGLPHALRWYNQIASYGSARSKLPGQAPAAAAADDDDDDVDLFGSDDEDEEERERIKVRNGSAAEECFVE